MIPIKNKKKTLDVTVEEMRRFSISYIEKYAPSKQQLKIYLLNSYLIFLLLLQFLPLLVPTMVLGYE